MNDKNSNIDSENLISLLDTQRFGFKVAKVNYFEDSPGRIIQDLKNKGVKLVFSRIDLGNITLLNELENIGFRVKDIQLTYTFSLKRPIPSLDKENMSCVVRPFRMEDLNEILVMLKESFDGYGHYFADSQLDQEKCSEIYADWGKRSCLDKGVADIVFVAECNKEIAGILSFKKYNDLGKSFAAGGLGAVLRKYRGQQVFKRLILEGLRWGADNELEWEEHNVIAYNYPVNSAFSTLGFRVTNSFVTMHCWIN